jgi:hypothetical protein
MASREESSGSARKEDGDSEDEDPKALPFPQKLHMLLQEAEDQNLTHVVSWNTAGTGFTIHNRYYFEAHIIPRFFNSSQYRAFQRSLNVWGFSMVSKGANRGTCWHPYFRRGREDLCDLMERVPIKQNASQESKQKVSSKLDFDQVQNIQLPPMRHQTGPSNAAPRLLGGAVEHEAGIAAPPHIPVSVLQQMLQQPGKEQHVLPGFIPGVTNGFQTVGAQPGVSLAQQHQPQQNLILNLLQGGPVHLPAVALQHGRASTTPVVASANPVLQRVTTQQVPLGAPTFTSGTPQQQQLEQSIFALQRRQTSDASIPTLKHPSPLSNAQGADPILQHLLQKLRGSKQMTLSSPVPPSEHQYQEHMRNLRGQDRIGNADENNSSSSGPLSQLQALLRQMQQQAAPSQEQQHTPSPTPSVLNQGRQQDPLQTTANELVMFLQSFQRQQQQQQEYDQLRQEAEEEKLRQEEASATSLRNETNASLLSLLQAFQSQQQHPTETEQASLVQGNPTTLMNALQQISSQQTPTPQPMAAQQQQLQQQQHQSQHTASANPDLLSLLQMLAQQQQQGENRKS